MVLFRQLLRLSESPISFNASGELLGRFPASTMLLCAPSGSVAEWLNAPVLKTGVLKSIVSSNLTGPAKKQ